MAVFRPVTVELVTCDLVMLEALDSEISDSQESYTTAANTMFITSV